MKLVPVGSLKVLPETALLESGYRFSETEAQSIKELGRLKLFDEKRKHPKRNTAIPDGALRAPQACPPEFGRDYSAKGSLCNPSKPPRARPQQTLASAPPVAL